MIVAEEFLPVYDVSDEIATVGAPSVRLLGDRRSLLSGLMRTATTDEHARRWFRRYWTYGRARARTSSSTRCLRRSRRQPNRPRPRRSRHHETGTAEFQHPTSLESRQMPCVPETVSGGAGAGLVTGVMTARTIGEVAKSWAGIRRQINSVAFSPDGKILATGGDNGVRLWDVATGRQAARQLSAGLTTGGPVGSVAFSPDGTTLATGGPGGTALWDVSYLTDPLARLCAQAGGSLTPADWSRYVQAGTPYQNACH